MGLVAPPAPRPRDGCFAAQRPKAGSPGPGRPWSGIATIIVVARFVPGGRTATTFTAGTVRLAWPRFAAADAVGATLWAAYAAGLGYLGVRRSSGVRCMPSCLVWAWPCWSPSRSRRRGGSGGAVLAVGARLADSRSNKDGQRRPRRSIVVRYYAATTEYGLS